MAMFCCHMQKACLGLGLRSDKLELMFPLSRWTAISHKSHQACQPWQCKKNNRRPSHWSTEGCYHRRPRSCCGRICGAGSWIRRSSSRSSICDGEQEDEPCCNSQSASPSARTFRRQLSATLEHPTGQRGFRRGQMKYLNKAWTWISNH